MPQYFLRLDAIKAAIPQLIGQRVHPHFAGYLAVLFAVRLSHETGETDPVAYSAITRFFQLFFAVGGFSSHPYFRPFSDANSGRLEHGWLNPNVAGSFALSSQRDSGIAVVVQPGPNRTVSLRPNHAKLVHQHFAHGRRIPVLPLATYLYRDYGFDATSKPNKADLLELFCSDFGLVGTKGQQAFTQLFHSTASDSRELFEEAP